MTKERIIALYTVERDVSYGGGFLGVIVVAHELDGGEMWEGLTFIGKGHKTTIFGKSLCPLIDEIKKTYNCMLKVAPVYPPDDE